MKYKFVLTPQAVPQVTPQVRVVTRMSRRIKRPDAELVEIARQYRTRTEWAKGDVNSYRCAQSRPAVFEAAVAHMVPVAHPYSGDYVVYVYEFADKSAYVGLTFNFAARKAHHQCQGPVFRHNKVCPGAKLVVAREHITSPQEAAETERVTVDRYSKDGWKMLNTRRAGGLGAVRWRKWTVDAVVADARRFSTKNEWRKKSQWAWKLARRNGWHTVATAHMPARNLPPQNRKQTCVTT